MNVLLNAFLFIVFFYFSIENQICQSAFVPTGTTVGSSNGSISYSIGQITYSCLETNEFSLNQGVQQPIEISIATVIPENFIRKTQFSIFPNPASQEVNISSVYMDFPKSFTINLYNLQGHQLIEKKFNSPLVTLNINHLPAGQYILMIRDNYTLLGISKIIKLVL